MGKETTEEEMAFLDEIQEDKNANVGNSEEEEPDFVCMKGEA